MRTDTDFIQLRDLDELAHARLDDSAWAYLSGGAADEFTLSDNQRAWQALRLWPRVLRPLAGGHARVRLLGREWPSPLLCAPVAYQRLAHPLGEEASALAAATQSAGVVLSAQASMPMEAVAQRVLAEPARGPLWFQLYLQPDRGFTAELVRRAEAAGYEALVLTVDAPTHGARDRERRAGFALPPGVRAVNLAGAPAAGPAPSLAPGQSALFDQLLPQAANWDDVAWLQSITRLPLLLKGVLHPADAAQARGLNVAGLVVSNHGGRTLDTALATADALPAVVAAAGPDMPVLVDGGIRRGTDVLKALALGARAVLVGRPVVFALAAGGPLAVARCLRLLRDEFEIAMALCGCRTVDDITPDLIAPPNVR